MAEKKSDQWICAKEKLEQCKDTIVGSKPTSTNIDYVDRVLHPSDPKDWQFIRYYKRINESVKDEFRQYQTDPDVLHLSYFNKGKCGKGNTVGQEWDKVISKLIQIYKDTLDGSKSCLRERNKQLYQLEENLRRNVNAELDVITRISTFFDLALLDSHFPLHGYMYSKTEESPKVYLWQGDADAVGWYKDSCGKEKYVILDWKVLDILEFWEKNKDAYGKYLHQCLVYAKLLQLHLKLDYLPHILIVPISGITGQHIRPALFSDYPKKCKELIESFEWSTTVPEPAQKISGKWPLFRNNLPLGKVYENMPLTKLFREDAKVSDLLREFGWHSLEVTADEIKNEPSEPADPIDVK